MELIRRRSFLLGLGALIAAPAIIRPGLLMPVKVPLIRAPRHVTSGNFPVTFFDGTWNVGDRWTQHNLRTGHRSEWVLEPNERAFGPNMQWQLVDRTTVARHEIARRRPGFDLSPIGA